MKFFNIFCSQIDRKSVELAQLKGASYNEKLMKFAKQMKITSCTENYWWWLSSASSYPSLTQ